jgi:hypothetical protein
MKKHGETCLTIECKTCIVALRLMLDVPFSYYSRIPLIRTMVIRIKNYPDRFGPSGKFVENSTKQDCLEITNYKIQCYAF